MSDTMHFIKRYHGIILVIAAALAAILSFFMSSPVGNSSSEANRISASLQRRMDKLNRYGERLLAADLTEGWPEIDGLPDDMVLYRFDADTLSCWFNVFPVTPFAEMMSNPDYFNFGRKWYVIKSISDGETMVLEGLLIKEEKLENMTIGENGINRHLHIKRGFDIKALTEAADAPVLLDGIPVFNVSVVAGGGTASSKSASFLLCAAALLMALTAIMLQLAGHRTIRNCLMSIGGIALVTLLARFLEAKLAGADFIFSPALYANDGIIPSFGSLLSLNTAIFLSILCIYLCRDSLADKTTEKKNGPTAYTLVLFLLAGLTIIYQIFALLSLIQNSSIALGVVRIQRAPIFSSFAYISFSLLMVAVLLLCECWATLYSRIKSKAFSFMTMKGILVFALLGTIILGSVAFAENLKREEARVLGWSNRLAMDRDLVMEKALMEIGDDIERDKVLLSLVIGRNAEQMFAKRLDEAYLTTLGKSMDIGITLFDASDPELAVARERLISKSIKLDPHFHYVYNDGKGSYYVGEFLFAPSVDNRTVLLLELAPKVSARPMSTLYSYAKYFDGRLVAFQGNYAYPTVMMEKVIGGDTGTKSFLYAGYRHFFNKINNDETIVVSRPRSSVLAIFVFFAYMCLLLFLLGMLMRPKTGKDVGNHSFSARVRNLVVLSLVVTLFIIMGVFSTFIYQRTNRDRKNAMSDRISTIQIMLDGLCRNLESADQMQTPEFARAVGGVAENLEATINIYAPDGSLCLSSVEQLSSRAIVSTRLEPEAFKAIMFEHQRYYVKKDGRIARYTLYAPIFNKDGRTVAIVAVPYLRGNLDFARDAIFHSAAMLSLFLILLSVAVLLATSITRQIFHPLVIMGQKMRGRSADSLELIQYDGDDEISGLVKAYNTMVTDLRESSARLAASERDKAWSEMARQVAHEIKNPLTPIKLEIQRLIRLKQKGDPRWEEKFEEVMNIVLEHIDILSQTASDFSDFAKLYSEEPVVIDLDKTLKDQILLFGETGAELTYLGIDGAFTKGPKPQLIRVFVNLLTNAEQAVAGVENARITVSLRKGDEGMWDIVFEDNGPGVPEENVAKIFNPNFTTKSSGTGLGLAISRNIVECCGGSIECTRSFSMGGACFTVSLPEVKPQN